MTEWRPTCPACETPNDAPDEVVCLCGEVSGTCRCLRCGTRFTSTMELWRWLGLDVPPEEPTRAE